ETLKIGAAVRAVAWTGRFDVAALLACVLAEILAVIRARVLAGVDQLIHVEFIASIRHALFPSNRCSGVLLRGGIFMRTRTWIVGLVLGAALLDRGAQAATPQDNLSADAAACAALEGHQIGPAHIVAATFVRTPYRTRWMLGGTATATVPFCRLEAYAEVV